MSEKNELSPAAKMSSLALLLKNKRAEIASVLPRHVTPERVIKVALQAASRNPLLLQCSSESFYLSVLCASELGLEPGGPLARAHMVPFRNNKTQKYECTLIPDYRGLVDLARRSGQIEDIDAHVVREGDEFVYAYGMHRELRHVPKADVDAPMTHAYAVAYLKGGSRHFVVLTKAEVERFKRKSRASTSGPWVTDYDAMAVKTAIRRLCNLLPQSVEMAKALAMDAAQETDVQYVPELLDVTPTPEEAVPETRTEAIKKQVAKSIKSGLDALKPADPVDESKQEKVAYILKHAAGLEKRDEDTLLEKILVVGKLTPEILFAVPDEKLDAAVEFVGEITGK